MSLPAPLDALGRSSDGIRLGDWLVQRSMLDRDQVDQALQTCQLLGCRVGDAVVHLRLLDRAQVETEVERREQYLEAQQWAPPPTITQLQAARDLNEWADITELIKQPARRAAALAIIIVVAVGLTGWLLLRDSHERGTRPVRQLAPFATSAVPPSKSQARPQQKATPPAPAKSAPAEEQKVLLRAEAEARAGRYGRALEIAMAALFAVEERGARPDPQAILTLARAFRRAPSSYRWQIDSLLIRASRQEDAPAELLVAAARVQRQRGSLTSAVEMLRRASAIDPESELVQRELRRALAQRARHGKTKAKTVPGRARRRS